MDKESECDDRLSDIIDNDELINDLSRVACSSLISFVAIINAMRNKLETTHGYVISKRELYVEMLSSFTQQYPDWDDK